MDEVRIGTFICHCGTNIAGVLDVPALTEYARTLPHVVLAQDNLYTCSDAGLEEIKQGITEYGLNRVVVAACTPRTHEPLFRRACQEAGLNPYLFEFVNIRDQCSWVHMQEEGRATEKAKDLLRMGVAKAALLEPEEEVEVQVNPSALVIGGGAAGLTAALSLANRGFKVNLVEKEPQLGGMLNHLYKLYPTYQEASTFIEDKINEVRNHPNVEVFTSAEVRDVGGFIGNYQVLVEQEQREIPLKVGVIIVATGAQEFKPTGMYHYDGRRVITQLELERLLGQGELKAKRVVMIQCVGARGSEKIYCSKICCMTAIKNAMLIQEMVPEVQVFILYRDMQSHGPECEDSYGQAREQGIIFIKYPSGRPPILKDGVVVVYDELLGEQLGIEYDLVVLSTPLVGQTAAERLSSMLKVPMDEHGFFLEAHVKLRPVDFTTDGIYLCGCAHWPADVSESIAQAYGAASRASIPLARGFVQVEPITCVIDEELCVGCGLCESLCPYRAISVKDTERGRKAEVILASCKGCGVCGAACPQMAITMRHFTDPQLWAQIDALMGEIVTGGG